MGKYGKTWGLISKVMQWIYTMVIKPVLPMFPQFGD
jgi:hypothetical protein